MKRAKMIGVIVSAAITVAAAWGYQQNKSSMELSSLALENIEALASGEGIFDDVCFWSCTFDYSYQCHVFGPGTMNPTYCFYYRAND